MGERRGTFTLYIYSLLYLCLEKAMATHSSTLAWKIPGTEEPGSLQSMGLLRVGQTEWLHFHFSLSCIGEGNGNPLQCSCLENPRDWGAWWAAVYRVAPSRTRLKRLSSSSSSWVNREFDLHPVNTSTFFLSWKVMFWKRSVPHCYLIHSILRYWTEFYCWVYILAWKIPWAIPWDPGGLQ